MSRQVEAVLLAGWFLQVEHDVRTLVVVFYAGRADPVGEVARTRLRNDVSEPCVGGGFQPAVVDGDASFPAVVGAAGEHAPDLSFVSLTVSASADERVEPASCRRHHRVAGGRVGTGKFDGHE